MKSKLSSKYDPLFFKQDVQFREDSSNSSYIIPEFPETTINCVHRNMSLRKHMNAVIENQSDGGSKTVLYIVVSHGFFVDKMRYVHRQE